MEAELSVNAGEVLHGTDRQRETFAGGGSVDLALIMTGNVHP